MKFRIRFAEQVVGMFVLLAIVAVAAILIFVGINQRWFARNYRFASRFDSGAGLSVGMPLMLKGFEIGKVTKVSLNTQNQVDIELQHPGYLLRQGPPPLRDRACIEPDRAGGDAEVPPGTEPGPPMEEDSFIPSLNTPEGRDLVERGLVVIPGR